MLVILLNCVTLGMFRPCEDIACDSQRCRILQVSVCVVGGREKLLILIILTPSLQEALTPRMGRGWGMFPHPLLWFSSLSSPHQAFDDFIFAFFAVEMVVKMVALGIFGKKCYLGDTWNRLDFFIVIAG